MLSRMFLFPLGLLAALIAVLYIAALEFYLFWALWWFDVMLHFLGGVWIAFLAFWFFFLARLVRSIPLSVPSLFAVLIASVFLVGVAWEIFEYVTGLYHSTNYVLDTVTDILMDLAGALAGAWYVLRSPFRAVLE